MDWQVGDLAVCIVPSEGSWSDNGDGVNSCAGPKTNEVTTVARVWTSSGELVLAFREYAAGDFNASAFRKIRPDEQQACEPEFITLLKRSKVPETASEFVLRVGQLAKRLNDEARKEALSNTVKDANDER